MIGAFKKCNGVTRTIPSLKSLNKGINLHFAFHLEAQRRKTFSFTDNAELEYSDQERKFQGDMVHLCNTCVDHRLFKSR